jgi:hypothetical protein
MGVSPRWESSNMMELRFFTVIHLAGAKKSHIRLSIRPLFTTNLQKLSRPESLYGNVDLLYTDIRGIPYQTMSYTGKKI